MDAVISYYILPKPVLKNITANANSYFSYDKQENQDLYDIQITQYIVGMQVKVTKKFLMGCLALYLIAVFISNILRNPTSSSIAGS